MSIQVEFWHLVGLALSLVGAWAGGAKLFFTQVDRRIDERFTAQERDRQTQYAALTALFQAHAEDEKKRLDRLDGDIKSHAERMARLEQDVERMPSHDDIGRLYDKLNSVGAGLAALGGKIDGIEASIRQVVGRLIDKGMRHE